MSLPTIEQIQNQLKELHLTPEEKVILKRIVQETASEGYSKTYQSMQKVDWKELPVSGKQFIEDPYYAGWLRQTLHPGVADDFVALMDRPVPVLELLLGGALRWGKSYMADLVLLYRLYRLGCMENPQEYLGVSPISTIYGINVSVTGYQASEGVFAGLRNMVDGSPFFREKFCRNTKVDSALIFPNRIVFKSGNSSEFSAIGKDVYMAVIDEASFFGVVHGSSRSNSDEGEYDAARILYEALSRRIQLTYTQHAIFAGLTILISSARYPQDFMERRREFVERLTAEGSFDGTIVEKRHSVWEVRDPAIYTKPKFKVEVGDAVRRSRILKEAEGEEKPVGRVVEVPGEYYKMFFDDIEASLRDLAGISTLSVHPFFKNKEALGKIFTTAYEHPYSVEVSNNLTEHLMFEKFSRRNALGKWKPIFNPEAPRGIHIDLAKSGDGNCPAGFFMGHVAGYKETPVLDPESLKEEMVQRPIVRTDLSLRIIARGDDEINQESIYRFIIRLRLFGFRIAFVTADQYQSANILRALKDKGIETFVKSPREKKCQPYGTWKGAVYEQRFLCYMYTPLLMEMTELENKTGVIDHPPGGLNDLSEAAAAVTDELCNRYATPDKALPVDTADISDLNIQSEIESGIAVEQEYDDAGTIPPSILEDIDKDWLRELNKFVLQSIPFNWNSFNREKSFVMLYLLKQRAKELEATGKARQAYLCMTEFEKHQSRLKFNGLT